MNINFDESIKRQKIIVTNKDFGYYFNLISNIFFALTVPAFFIAMLIFDKNLNTKKIIFAILVLIPFTLNFIGLFFINKITFIRKINIEEKENLTKNLIEKYQFTSKKEVNHIIILQRDYSFFISASKLILIFDDENNLYANLNKLGRFDIIVPFYSLLYNSQLFKLVKRYFK